MPVYNAKRYARTKGLRMLRTRFDQQRVRFSSPTAPRQTERVVNRQKSMNGKTYNVYGSALRMVEKAFRLNMTAWAVKRHQQTRRPVTIVDWGCEDGTAIGELARKTTGIARCFGFDRVRNPNWRQLKNVTFLQRMQEHFPRYFKDGSIDLLYGHWGLFHILRAEKEEGFVSYMGKLKTKLAKGGMIVTSPLTHARVRLDMDKLFHLLNTELNQQGMRFQVTYMHNTLKIKRIK